MSTPFLARHAAQQAKARQRAAKPKAPTAAQRAAVATWATTPLEAHTRAELATGLAVLRQHPDATAAGFSRAKNALRRLEAFLSPAA